MSLVPCLMGLARGSRSTPNSDDDQKKQEMVTTVCMKCHMLVMLCKSTLVCPNCKFTHPNTAPQKTLRV